MFALKKLVTFVLMPLPLCLALLVFGLILTRAGRGSRPGRLLIILSALLLALFSNIFVSKCMLRPLEARYSAMPANLESPEARKALSGCEFVVVLGGGHSDMPSLPATSQLSTSALGRIVEGVRILKSLPGATLIVSGPGERGRPSHAAMLAAAAESLGISPSRIIQVDTARDTEDESHTVAKIANGRRIALVTSAWHMPRAAHLFRMAGVAIVPTPADFVARDTVRIGLVDLTWDSESLVRSTLAVHEWLGLVWLKLRGA